MKSAENGAELREKKGLAYYIRAGASNYKDTGVFQVSAGVQVSKLEQAVKVIQDELQKISSELVGAKELLKAKEYIKGKTVLALEDNQVRLDWYLEQIAFKKDIETPDLSFKKVDAVTPKQIKNLAKALINKNKMTLAVIGPYKNLKSINKLVK